MVTAILREASCERGGRAAILVQYDSIFIEIALYRQPIRTLCTLRWAAGRRAGFSENKSVIIEILPNSVRKLSQPGWLGTHRNAASRRCRTPSYSLQLP